MSVQAFILVHIRAGKIVPVIERLTRLPGVKEAYPITGNYDAIIKAEVNDLKDVHQVMIDRIHQIDGVTDTSTHIVLQ
ncbi:TPA: Lrp/AsnC family transcriptional regulator [Candidatus Bipolaricaulota bacterium]|nr:Lrp/AsnC family transcriptional regulator [Candidatus Bipolaricaulota bacterium]